MGVIEQDKVVRPMTFQVVKTKAEQAILEHFACVEGTLPGNADLAKVRREAIGRFASVGLPHRRVEEWKYTDLRNLVKEAATPAPAALKTKAVDLNKALGALCGHECYRVTFVDGQLDRSLSTLKGLPAGLTITPLAEALVSGDKAVAGRLEAEGERSVLATLNAAFVTDGALVRVGAGTSLDKPIELVFLTSSAEPHAVSLRNEIEIGKGARATLVEVHVGLPGSSDAGQVNAVTSVAVDDTAAFTHVKVADQRPKAVHLWSLFARLGKGSNYRPFQLTMGGGVTRNEISVTYGGESGSLDLSGIFLGRGSAHIDTTLVVDHAVPRCQSRELFKGVLDGEAHGIFQGKIIVRPDAQKTDGKQMAQALMLSPDAEFSSKPELEIYADDVVCGHGSTAAELDDDLMFYLRSRGIPAAEARALLIESFIGEAVERIEADEVREAVRAEALRWLRVNLA